MQAGFLDHLTTTLADIEAEGLLKRERQIATPQSGRIALKDGREHDQPLRQQLSRPCRSSGDHRRRARRRSTATASAWPRSASSAARRRCTASSSSAIADYLGKDDAILFAACFDANGGLFEPLLGDEDAIISDALNHASIIDGVRLCKAKRYRYANSRHGRAGDAAEGGRRRRRALQAHRHRRRLLDGRLRRQPPRRSAPSPSATARWSWSTIATPPAISATKGRGTPALTGAGDRVDIVTGTFGKTLGGAHGRLHRRARSRSSISCASARGPICSPTPGAAVAAGSLKAIEIAEAADDRREQLMRPHAALPRRP